MEGSDNTAFGRVRYSPVRQLRRLYFLKRNVHQKRDLAGVDVEGVIDCHGVCFQERKHVPTAMCTRVGGRTESSMGEVSGAAVHSVQSRSMNLG